ncbi:MAG: 5'/3'-nucleotidase SurE [Alphaproteobacteria bacterium]
MRILLSNDDGIHSQGIKVLEEIVKEHFTPRPWVVAPKTEQSARSHAITTKETIELDPMEELGERHYAVAGTPADSVFLGLKEVLKEEEPDLILTGINYGSNLGEDINYSGTVGAAMEGMLQGIPAIALSLRVDFAKENPRGPFWDTPRKFAPEIIKKLFHIGWPDGVIMNVNFPNLPPEDVKGVKIVRQGARYVLDVLEEAGEDENGNTLYRRNNPLTMSNLISGTDRYYAKEGYITITPLHLDFTHFKTLETLQKEWETK